MKYKVGIVGVGKLGSFHCNSLSQNPKAELAGVYDTDQTRVDEITSKFKCQGFSNVDDLIENSDIVGIIVPTTLHLDIAKKAIQAKKPIFVEKPIASSVEEAEIMVKLADEMNVPIQVGHIERFNPAIRAVDKNGFNPMFIESHRLAPFDPRGTDVAVILDLMIHDIDIILSLVNSDPVQINANGVAVVSDEIDIANARIQFENGCVANITASRISQRKMRKMRLFQKDSYTSIDFLQRLTEVFKLVDENSGLPNTVVLGQIDKGKHKRHIIYDQPETPEQDAMQAEWHSFFNALETNTPPIVSGHDGLKALRVASEIMHIIAKNPIKE